MKNGLYIDITDGSIIPYIIILNNQRTPWSMSVFSAISKDVNLDLNIDARSITLLYEFDSVEEFIEKYPEEFI